MLPPNLSTFNITYRYCTSISFITCSRREASVRENVSSGHALRRSSSTSRSRFSTVCCPPGRRSFCSLPLFSSPSARMKKSSTGWSPQLVRFLLCSAAVHDRHTCTNHRTHPHLSPRTSLPDLWYPSGSCETWVRRGGIAVLRVFWKHE